MRPLDTEATDVDGTFTDAGEAAEATAAEAIRLAWKKYQIHYINCQDYISKTRRETVLCINNMFSSSL